MIRLERQWLQFIQSDKYYCKIYLTNYAQLEKLEKKNLYGFRLINSYSRLFTRPSIKNINKIK